MQKDDGNPSGGERRPESGELLADSGKREAQARRPRRGTRRTDGPLGKHESKNTKKMIAAQAIDPAKDIAASRERIAREDERAKRKSNPIDRLLTPKKRVNDAAYLAQTLRSLKLERVMLSGSAADESVTALLCEMGGKDGTLLTGAMLSVDGAAQEMAAQADGVVLVVHLWKTRRDDLEQEIRICQKLGYPVLVAVVII